ncbi:MAG: hypothetical protein WC121_08820 [Candidatus Kapaibacterium sp.]
MKYLLFSIIIIATFSCSEYPATGPVNPSFDPPVVNEMLITLENAQQAGILRFGPVLVPITDTVIVVDDVLNTQMYVYPSIATSEITLTFSNVETTNNLMYLVRANINSYLSKELYFGSYIGISNSKYIYVIENSVRAAGIFYFGLSLKGLPDGVYVLYLKDNDTGVINGEAAFFKTTETNRNRIYKNLNIGNYR